ncbi:MAG: LysR family transcriptional regulator [Rhodococcus sp. (in: high G+C Gram-positive bacteria)]
MNFEVQTLRWYIAVADELHFARAAKSLNIARTKLSRAVIDLEAELGYPLFVPGESPTRSTEQGLTFLSTARALVEEDDRRRDEEAAARAALATTLTVGYTEGVTPTKWTRIWAERFPGITLELVATTAQNQMELLHDGTVDVGFVRLPVDRDGLDVIGLYEETPVVVAPKDHPVAAFDRIAVDDLSDEHLLQDQGEVPEWAAIATEVADGTRLAPPPLASNSELVEYVAAGLGIAIVPQSIARLHARKDLVYRPVDGVAGSSIALAWPTDKKTDNIEEFFGIVRGRSVRSSRGAATPPAAGSAETPTAGGGAKTPAKRARPAKSTPVRKAPARGKRPRR